MERAPPLAANCWQVGDSALLRGARVAISLLGGLAGGYLMPTAALSALLAVAGGVLAVVEWRRRGVGFNLQFDGSGWALGGADSPPQSVELAPRQWLFGPLLLLVVRQPGRRWLRQYWVCRDALPSGDYRRLCRTLLIGSG